LTASIFAGQNITNIKVAVTSAIPTTLTTPEFFTGAHSFQRACCNAMQLAAPVEMTSGAKKLAEKNRTSHTFT
jgi:hypothetical protein